MQIEAGAILEGKVTGITKFGAFVSLPEGKSGLIHISEVANAFVTDVNDFLSEGQQVRVKVLSVSPEGKISLSAKKAAEPAAPTRSVPAAPRREERSRPAPIPATAGSGFYVPQRSNDQNFEDKLKHFMQESDSKMSGNRLFEQQKKTRGRRK